jgi:hypothetical protein
MVRRRQNPSFLLYNTWSSFCKHYSSLTYEPILISVVSTKSSRFIDAPNLNLISVLILWRAGEALKSHFLSTKNALGGILNSKSAVITARAELNLGMSTCRLGKLLMYILTSCSCSCSCFHVELCSAFDNSETGWIIWLSWFVLCWNSPRFLTPVRM